MQVFTTLESFKLCLAVLLELPCFS